MKLYYAPGACSLIVRIILNELGLSAAFESVDLRSKKTASGNNYLEINSHRKCSHYSIPRRHEQGLSTTATYRRAETLSRIRMAELCSN